MPILELDAQVVPTVVGFDARHVLRLSQRQQIPHQSQITDPTGLHTTPGALRNGHTPNPARPGCPLATPP